MIQKIRKLFTVPTQELGKWTRFLVFQVRIWFHCLRLLKINKCGTQAAALAYHSVFGLVPLAIVTLMVFQMFPAFQGVSEKVVDFAYDYMNLTKLQYPTDTGETVMVSEFLDDLAENYVSKAHTGAITVVGLALVIWAAIALLTTIEKTFNHICHVSSGRGFLHRLFNYWALLTLGPILLGLGVYVSTQVMKHKLVQKLVPAEQQQIVEADLNETTQRDPNAMPSQNAQSGWKQTFAIQFTAKVVPFLISLIAFFFLYFFLPNTRISPGSAMWGAFVGTLIFMLAKWGFGMYVTKFVPQFAVYGVLGIIPITVLWIYISWMIVLFGLQLTYATQNIKRLDAVELSRARRKDKCFLANDQTVIRVMEYVLNVFERKDQRPVSVEAVAHRLSMPLEFSEKILEHMVQSELLCRTTEPSIGYVPSTDGTHIKLDEISTAISEVSFARADETGPARMLEVFEQMRGHLSRFTLKEVLNKAEDFESAEDVLKEIEADQNEPS
ncbi:MAG: YhjD/YihY/BrkB family envelope integrity protein [Planctomycetota bacterium]|jgi:membrane protein